MIAPARPAPRAQAVPAVAGPAEPTTTAIRPARRWQLINAGELWRFRELIVSLTVRDVKVRYKQSVLGVAWAILQPLMTMIVFTIVFGQMAKLPSGGVPYPLFVIAGLLPWTFFAAAVTAGSNSVVNSGSLITKIYFPRLAIPIASVGSAVVDFVISFGLLVAMMLYYGVSPGFGLLLVPVISVVITLAALGLGTLLGAVYVAYRDLKHVIPFLIQLGMFATPTIYMQADGASGGWSSFLLALNPMIPLITSFRAATLGGPIPWGPLAIAAAVVAPMALVGGLYFRRLEDRFADII